MKWPEVIQSIAAQTGTIYTTDEVKALPWHTKAMWLQNNPVTAARIFQHRLDSFWMKFIKSKSHPVGEVTDFVIGIEFQARGRPHAHTLLWVKDAPRLGHSDVTEVINFIDTYISYSIPETDEELKELVQTLQQHTHSATCRRRGTCRFNFPKPPTDRTIITDEPTDNIETQLSYAKQTIAKVYEVLNNTNDLENITLEEVLQKADVSKNDYIHTLSISNSGRTILLKRKPAEQRVNPYCPAVLRAWEANMDIQYIVNAYACVMYIASYVLKAEKGMSDLLRSAAKESDRDSMRAQLKKVGSVSLQTEK